jgi:carbon-monoxide dehydrogenase small subunit
VTEKIRFILNSRRVEVDAHPMTPLLDVLRELCDASGTKYGCGEGECGACSIVVNSELVMSCLVPACQAHEAIIWTVEGLANDDGTLHPMQQAFIDEGGAQCGICTPGMLMAAVHFLEHPESAPGGVREALAGNLCRCTGYSAIYRAVERAIEEDCGC